MFKNKISIRSLDQITIALILRHLNGRDKMLTDSFILFNFNHKLDFEELGSVGVFVEVNK